MKQLMYHVVEITPIDQNTIQSQSEITINNHGVISGSYIYDERTVNFIYNRHSLRIIDILSSYQTRIRDINDRDEIVGTIFHSIEHIRDCEAFILSGEQLTIIPSSKEFEAISINNDSVVLLNKYPHISSIWDHQFMKNIDIREQYRLQAKDLNDTGMVVGVGYQKSMNARWRAFVYHQGVIDLLPLLPLGNPDKRRSSAYSINNTGDIVGVAGGNDIGRRPFLYSSGIMYELGSVESHECTAVDINDRGDIIGYAVDKHTKKFKALLWQDNHPILFNTCLCNPEWDIQRVFHINNQGEVVGIAYNQGIAYYVLLVPQM